MILFLYNLCLTILAPLAVPIVTLALLLRPRYRRGLQQRLGFLPPEVAERLGNQAPLWLHAPSVGEMLATRPFLRALKQALPGKPVLLSSLTPTAYTTVQEKIPEADMVIYFPLDHPLFVGRVLAQIKPAVFFFTETEMWPNFLSALATRGIPAFLVSGRFSARALARYCRFSLLFTPILRNLTLCCMQTQTDADRIVAAGATPERVVVTGNFKADSVGEPGDNGRAILTEVGLSDRLLLIGASTHPGEEAFLLRAYRQLHAIVPHLLLLLAPRHPQRFAEVETLLQTEGYAYVKRSQLSGSQTAYAEVFLLDTLGELASFYPAAALTFVGGSLSKGPGGHSVMEPALAQVPVYVGPYTRNFATVVEELIRAGGGFKVHDEKSFCEKALPLLTNVQARQEAGRRALTVIRRSQGAVERTLVQVLRVLEQSDAGYRHSLPS